MDSDDDFEDDAGRHLLGLVFGNIDDSGDVDADYLDDDAREHLAALAGQLGPSLVDLDLAGSSSSAAEKDYGGSEEARVDHEDDDDDEQDEGPEVEAAAADGFPLTKQESFLLGTSVDRSVSYGNLLGEEDYDADDEKAKETQVAEDDPAPHMLWVSRNREELSDGGDLLCVDDDDDDRMTFDVEDLLGGSVVAQESTQPRKSSGLPVLYIENGVEVLRFSEIFDVHPPLKKVGRRKLSRNRNSKANVESLDVSDTMEDDEENFLKSACSGTVFARRVSSGEGDCVGGEGDCVEGEGGNMGSLVSGHDRVSCLPGQPMKERMTMHTSPRWQEPGCSGFCPLDQQDWEEKIVWGSSPATSDGTSRSCVMSEHDSDTCITDAEVGAAVSSHYLVQGVQTKSDEDHNLVSLDASEGPFVSRRIPEPTDCQSSLQLSHSRPQILRLDSCRKFSTPEANVKSLKIMERLVRGDAERCFKQLSLRNKDLLDGCWLDRIIWDPSDPIPKPKLVLDLQDEQMSFETLEQSHIGQVYSHAGAIVANYPLCTSLEDSLDHSGQHRISTDGFNISKDEFYSGWETCQQSKFYAKKRANHLSKVIHSVPTMKLQTMKPRLRNKEIVNFHRPKALWYPRENKFASEMQGNLCTQGSIKIMMKTLGGLIIKLHLDVEETLSSIKPRLAKKLDLKLPEKVRIFYSGKELQDDKSLATQDVKPNSLLDIVQSKIHLCYRVQLLPGERKSFCPPGAFRKKSDLSPRDGHVFLMEYCEERPLLLGNVGMSARICSYYRNLALGDETTLPPQNPHDVMGHVLTLDPADESPFLGDINHGFSQPSLETNMYRAPLFPHKLLSTDYLLIRSAKGMLSLRRIDKLCVVGQQEPHMEVISPGVIGVRNYNSKRLLVHVYREFLAKQKSGLCPYIRADELSLHFPSLTEVFLKRKLKHCARLQRRLNGCPLWVKKSGFQIPSEEEVRRILTPEDVCSYESMQTGLYRLKHLGISKLRHPVNLSSRLNQLPNEAVTLAAASHIERELLITPWNLSSNFVACANQGLKNIQCLEITGAGDPSGRGLGFSYIRATWPTARIPLLSTVEMQKVPALQGASTTSRADADLQSSSMGPISDNFSKLNFLDHQIRKITRRDQSVMIHQLSSKQAASSFKIDTTTPSNSQQTSYLPLHQQARRKCQEIWDQQVHSLSSADVNQYESNPKADGDLDSFAVDLENLLDAEEFEGKHRFEHRNGITDVDEGQQVGRRYCQLRRVEENEDEEVEAALIRICFDDVGDIRIKKEEKVKHITKGASTSLTSKDPIMQNTKLEKIPVKKLFLNLKPINFEKSDDIPAELVKMQNKVVVDGQKIIKEVIDKPRREFFVCGACGQMGHMRSNKNCPRYGEEVQTSELENSSAKSNLIEAVQPPLQTPENKLMRLEISERSEKSGVDIPRRALQLKFKYIFADELHEDYLPGSHCSDRLLTSKEKTDTQPIAEPNEITPNSCDMRSEDKQQKLQSSHLVLLLPARPKIIFKQPKDVNNTEQGIQAAGVELDCEFTNVRKTAEQSSLEEQKWQGQCLAEEVEESRTPERSNFLGEEKRCERTSEEGFWRTQVQQRLPGTSGHTEPDGEHAQKGKKKRRKTISVYSYSKEYKTSRNARRMHDRDQAARKQSTADLGCHVAECSLPRKRRRGGEVLLSNILEDIVNRLREHKQISSLFMKPVSKKEAPDYLDIIEHPMDLSTIKEKVRRMQYRSREDFRHDVWQINFNAHRYNDGRNPGIAFLADQLLEICDHFLNQSSASLTEAEDGIELLNT